MASMPVLSQSAFHESNYRAKGPEKQDHDKYRNSNNQDHLHPPETASWFEFTYEKLSLHVTILLADVGQPAASRGQDTIDNGIISRNARARGAAGSSCRLSKFDFWIGANWQFLPVVWPVLHPTALKSNRYAKADGMLLARLRQ